MHFALDKTVRFYYYTQKTIVFDKHSDSENNIPKSNHSSISVPLKYKEFQDCVDFHILHDYTFERYDRLELVKRAVGCHFLTINQTNSTSLSLQNINLSESNTQLCSLSYREDEIGNHSGIFNVTLTPIQQSCEESECILKAVYTNTMLALTCKACFERPCVIINENSTVTFLIPFILTNKTYIIESIRSHDAPNLCIVLFAALLLCFVFFLLIIIIYQYMCKTRCIFEK